MRERQFIISNNLEIVPGYELCTFKAFDDFGKLKLPLIANAKRILFVLTVGEVLKRNLSAIEITLRSGCKEVIVKTDNEKLFVTKLLDNFTNMSWSKKMEIVGKLKFMAA